MKTMEQIRKEALALSASERAGLAHELIISLEDPGRHELSPAQEAEIQRRVRLVRKGQGAGRPAAKVLADLRAKLR